MTTRTWKPSRRLVATRTGAAALLLSGASLLGLAVLSAGAATASAGSVTSVDPSTNQALSGPQPANTVFSANLPSGAACPGDTASDAYHVYSFLVPTGTDPASVSFATGVPSAGFGYFDSSGYQGPINTAVKTGQVVGLPNDLQWSTYPGASSDLTGTSSKTWDAGWACADGQGVVQRYWDQQVTFATAGSGFTWTVAASATGTTTSSSSSTSTSSTSTSTTSTTADTTTTTADTTTTLDPNSTSTTLDPNSTTTVADGTAGSTSTTVCVPQTTSTSQAARTTTTTAADTTTTAAPASTSTTETSRSATATCSSSSSSTSSTLGAAAAVKGDSLGAAASNDPPAAASGSSTAQSALPFTGLPGDKAVALGIFLIGAGLALVVAAHRRQELERLMWPDQV